VIKEFFIYLIIYFDIKMPNEIDVAKYLTKLEKAGMENPLDAINSCMYELADEIRKGLLSGKTVSC